MGGISGRPIVQTSVSQTGSGNLVAAGTASQTVQVYALVLVASATVTLTLTNFTGAMTMIAGVPLVMGPFIQPDGTWRPIFETAAGAAFADTQSGAGTIAGSVWSGTGPQ